MSPVPGLAVSHATHFTASGLFRTRHVSQSHVPAGLENIVPNPVVVAAVEVLVLLLSRPTEVAAEGSPFIDLIEEELGCGAIQQTHFVSDGLFCTKQTSQLHPDGALNKSPNPGEDETEEVVVVEEGAVGGLEVFCRVSSGSEEVGTTGEAKPEQNKQDQG